MRLESIKTIVVFFLLSASCLSQNDVDLYLYKKANKLGLIDSQGNVVLPAKYSHIGNFKEGRAAVTITTRARNDYHKILNTKLGYIDAKGKVVIPLRFQHIPDEIKDYSEGLAVIKVNNKYGYIDHEGKVVIEPKFSRAYPFSEGYAVVEFNGDYGNRALIDKNGQIVFRFLEKYRAQVDSLANTILVSNSIPQLSEDKITVHRYDSNGQSIASVFNSKGEVLFTKALFGIKPYKDGIATATKNNCRIGSENCFMLIDAKGNTITEVSYYPIVRLKKDVFLVEDATTGYQKIINSKGDTLEPLIEEGTRLSTEDLINERSLIRVRKGGVSGYVDASGRRVIDIQYDNTSPFSEGLAFVRQRDHTVLCIDENGTTMFEIDPKYYAGWGISISYVPFPLGVFKNGLATLSMTIDGKNEWVVITKTGALVTINDD